MNTSLATHAEVAERRILRTGEILACDVCGEKAQEQSLGVAV